MKLQKRNELLHRSARGRWFALLMIAAGLHTLVMPSVRAAKTEPVISDAGITSAVEEGLIFAEGILPNDVEVHTSQGVVTLSGAVDNPLAKARALEVAESIRGVRDVINLTIVTPVSRPDAEIRQDVLTALLQDPATESYQVAVTVQDAVATLTGSVGSNEEKRLAAEVANGVKGIKQVRNNLTVNYLAKRTDAEMAADVTARLQWDVWINGDLIDAAVKDGKVTLTGTVGSLISKGRASDDGWVNGVTAVDVSGIQIEPWAGNNTREKYKYPAVANGEIKKAITAALRLDPRVSAFSPDVTVEDGVAILGGSVGNLKAKSAAEQDARDTVGVWAVYNYLKVRPKGRPTDAEMEKQLKAALLWDPWLTASTIDAAVINRTAYLSGEVASSFERTEARDVASRIKGVLLVRNRLKVVREYSIGYIGQPYYASGSWPYDGGWPDNNWPHYTFRNFGPEPYKSDEEIKKRIESALFWSPFVNHSDIHVDVNGGVATLTGSVGNWVGWGEADTDARRNGAAFVINEIKIRKNAW